MDRYGELDENILIGKVMLGEAAKQLDILTRGIREGIWRPFACEFPFLLGSHELWGKAKRAKGKCPLSTTSGVVHQSHRSLI